VRALKWSLAGLGGLLLLAIIAVVVFVATFDPNAYKPRIVDLVKRETGRTLTVDGTIGLTIFPRLGASVGGLTLSEPNSPRIFARVGDAHVAVALLPLLSRRVIVDRVTLTGLAMDLVRYKDGRTNFDDLTGRGAPGAPSAKAPGQTPPAPPLAIDVGGISVEDATIGWRDEGAGTDVHLSHVSLKTGRLASGEPGKLSASARVQGAQPKANLEVGVETGYRIDLQKPAVALSSLDVKVAGEAEGIDGLDARLRSEGVELDPQASRITLSRLELTAKTKSGLDAKVAVPRLDLAPDRAESQTITADVALVTPQRKVSAKLAIPSFAASATHVDLSRLDVELTAKQGDLEIQGKLGTPLALDLERRRAELPGIAGDLAVSGKALPGPSKATVRGAARADWGARSANAELAATLDDSKVDVRVAVANWSRPAISFAVVADRLDVDRYLPASRRSGAPSGGGGAPSSGGTPPVEQPFDLSALKPLTAAGTVKIGALRVSNVNAEQVSLAVKAAGGRLVVDPIAANLYQGVLAGSATVNANDDSFALKDRLTGISVGPLLRDAASKDLLEGRGTVVLDVTTRGNTVTGLKKALGGTATLALTNGTIKGVDLGGILRTASALLGSRQALEQQAAGGAKTDFTELGASFVIRSGVAHNEDLRVTSPVLKVAGRGDVDVGQGTLDYTVKVSVTGAAAGLGGKDLAQLAGATVPVRVTGPLSSLRYSVDLQSLATELARSALQRELERRLAPGKSGGEQGAGSAVGDVLRGLFGKPK